MGGEERGVGVLYVVGTPIGNLEDVTLRALRVLREVRLIAAEDTRETRKLLSHFGITTALTSYFEHNKLQKLDYLLGVLRSGSDVAVVSDAGMPGISDPGYELIREALKAGVRVIPVPGPSAVLTALAVSGLPTDQFVYLGFLPRRPAERRRALVEVAVERRTLVAFESPHRVLDALRDAQEVLGDRPVAVASELTKLFEEVHRGPVSEVREQMARSVVRGEYTLVIAGAPRPERASEDEVAREVERLADAGRPAKETAAEIARSTGWPRREVYRLLLARRKCANI